MKKTLKKILLKLGLLDIARAYFGNAEKTHENNRRKQDRVRDAKRRFSPAVFIETGTYLGDMVEAMKHEFMKLYSIELSPELYAAAVKRFKNDPHVTILNGDSAAVMPTLLADIHEPALFWLDAHYSAGITARADIDTPIEGELNVILAHSITSHGIMIDDARLFVGSDGYPTLAAVRKLIDAHGGYAMEVKDDIIHIFPKAR